MHIAQSLVNAVQSGNADAVAIVTELLGQYKVSTLTDEQAVAIANVIHHKTTSSPAPSGEQFVYVVLTTVMTGKKKGNTQVEFVFRSREAADKYVDESRNIPGGENLFYHVQQRMLQDI